jgi:two-component system sensor histidine kinase MprB
MQLRKRVSLAAAGVVAVAVAIAMIVSYSVVRGQLRGDVDSQLTGQEQVDLTPAYLRPRDLPGLSADQGGSAPYEMYVNSAGVAAAAPGATQLPVFPGAVAIAKGTVSRSITDQTVRQVHLRVLIFHAVLQGYATSGPYQGEQVTVPVAIELARPLTQVDHLLSQLRFVLAILFLGCIALAAMLGRMAARRVLAPLAEVTSTAQTIGETDDLSLRLAVHADDEVGQLATRFNEMLERLEDSRAALDASVRSQRQLVADASHELRTPVTSLRTNIEVLLEGGSIDEEDRRRLLADVVEQSEELTQLVSDLIEVARGDLPASEIDEIRLDRLVEECLARARRNSPEVAFDAHLAPVLIAGNPERLTRAINNLLDNAARHTAPDGPVEVTVDAGGVRVRDHGDGVEEADLPFIFDRFYRGANSRSRQGSGLGLAIVRQVAEQHGGSATASNPPGGGALFTLALPGAEALEGEENGDDPVYGAGGFASRF